MTDSQWSLVIGAALVIVTRLVDVMLPKGYMAKFMTRWLTKTPKDSDSAPDEE